MTAAHRHVHFIVYDGFELLDMAGPASVFSTADALRGGGLYRVIVRSTVGGVVTSSAGIGVATERLDGAEIGGRDTVLVVGSSEGPLRRAVADEALAVWLVRNAGEAERFGSICSGAFVLAATGLADGRRIATHWAGADALSRLFPRTRLEPDALYVEDGALWTSAGVTSGIDMALAMLKRDTDAGLMGEVARQLVVYAHRPGGQSQFSAMLAAQTAAVGTFAELVAWMEASLAESLTADVLAARVGMSERSFYRKFSAALGMTPHRFVETLRLERAKRLLEAGSQVKSVAAEVGFRSEGGFRAAFIERFGLSPSTHRLMHTAGSPASE